MSPENKPGHVVLYQSAPLNQLRSFIMLADSNLIPHSSLVIKLATEPYRFVASKAEALLDDSVFFSCHLHHSSHQPFHRLLVRKGNEHANHRYLLFYN